MTIPTMVTGTATSADGTSIVFDRLGAGPVVVLVHGAITDRSHPTLAEVARVLSRWFTVVNYDRRGRGGSGDTRPYAVQREIEDLAAVITATGDRAMVFGGSSGAALALEAAARLPAITAARLPAITCLALWEPPYHVDSTAPHLPDDFAARLTTLIEAGRPGDAVELFMVRAAEVPADAVAGMRSHASWPHLEAIARTLAYEAEIMSPANRLPTAIAASLTQPALVLNGGDSPAWMRKAGTAVARTIPTACHRLLPGQSHDVAPQALAPELLEFFAREQGHP
ncbi:alpha/beta fold hydrolase [Nonomuraea cavernae]|uniref:Alpha/beta hydrolase n=1 Tax=Nonomuraea cavernae TaxID=2045107 RepID=A0A917YP81_9ACTN|nr:alpha/beta hydrolase [Nonomuraea cavernae]MCA2184232.1 alpha/beta hydrolase [Nonomuraea cavernae]GGO62719.1 alpha/beta hydrolase [Nonomuraea cavernae]